MRDYYNSFNNPIKNTNLVILAYKHNKVKILEYLFGNDSKILNNLSVDIGKSTVLPNDENEVCHNTLYYAIRSGNIHLLDTLINKWPGSYFVIHLGELDGILSIPYEELKLRDVPLSEEIEIFVENTLINLCFFFNIYGQYQSFRNNVINIKERIELILQSISLLKAEYSNTEIVDKKFLFLAKFIAQNIHILKRQFESIYDRLPWEEMEFCLISFVVSFNKQQEINIFYRAILNKGKLLKFVYFCTFRKYLQ